VILKKSFGEKYFREIKQPFLLRAKSTYKKKIKERIRTITNPSKLKNLSSLKINQVL
jgi:hypothetical protein